MTEACASLQRGMAASIQREMAEAYRDQKMAEAVNCQRLRFDGAQIPTQSQAQLVRTFRRLRTEAERCDLFDLAQDLGAFAEACSTDDRKNLQALLGLPQIRSQGELLRALSQQAHGVEQALLATQDPARAAFLADRPSKSRDTILTALASSGNFDLQHRMGSLMNGGGNFKLMSMLCPGREDEQRARLAEFEASDPLTECREQEADFLASRAAASALPSWTQANEMGRRAWSALRFWTAEMAWSRALDLLDDAITPREHAKILTNRSYARVLLGRRCRSTGVGYFKSSVALLEAAAADAERATHLDACWIKGAVRQAEALSALGPYHRSLEVCRILSKAVKIADDLPQEDRASQQTVCDGLPAALASAKTRAKVWCAVKPGTAPDAAVWEATEKLTKTIARALALPQQEDSAAASINLGRQIADNVATIGALLQAGYCDEAWRFADEETPDKLQLELRKLVRVFPCVFTHAHTRTRTRMRTCICIHMYDGTLVAAPSGAQRYPGHQRLARRVSA